jgi:hypothetical protein
MVSEIMNPKSNNMKKQQTGKFADNREEEIEKDEIINKTNSAIGNFA